MSPFGEQSPLPRRRGGRRVSKQLEDRRLCSVAPETLTDQLQQQTLMRDPTRGA